MTRVSVNPHDPADVVAQVAFDGPDEVEAAVAAARKAADGWRRLPALERGRLIGRIGTELADVADELAALITREVGKPIVESRAEVGRAVAIHRYYAQVALLADGETYPAAAPGAWNVVRRHPVGVCGLITPWNFPVAIPSWKAAPALVYGNATVLKPAPEASEVGRRYGEIAARILPDDVLRVVLGDAECGRALVESPGVDAISFTGSIEVGRAVATSMAARGARFQGELSGNNPSVVLADADLEQAARIVAGATMGFAGQKCTATGRVIVAEPAYDAFRELLVEAVSGLELLDPAADSCEVGPLVSDEARSRALGAVEELGGNILTGGKAVAGAAGFYMEPTLVEVPPSRAAGDEIFAPVALLTSAADPEDALAQANAAEHGLVGALFTSELDRALEFADRLDAGLVRINAPTTGVDYHLPFGGAKASGIGPREQGLAARDFYTTPRTILLNPVGS